MKKFMILYVMTILFAVTGCNKLTNENDNPSENWFIDEGWTEVIMEYGNPCTEIGMEIDVSGNIIGIYKHSAAYYDHYLTSFEFRFFSSLDTLVGLEEAPTDGYTSTFLCQQSKYGVSRKYHNHWNVRALHSYDIKEYYYYLFYIKRINDTQYKVFYKEKEEWHEYL